ncbi:MAG: preprotein translocase subunit SecG [Polyangiaceae bacterium]|nr:preprotein translocase subunit SecG [Polyangiaceae bacterium]
MATFVTIVHVFVCLVLMFVVLIQQGKGGGMGSAFGGASAQVFGGSGAGNILTRATAICAAVFMITSVALAHEASSQDRLLRKRTEEQAKKNEKGAPRETTPAVPPGDGNGALAPGSSHAPSGEPASPPASGGEPADDYDEQDEQDESH